MMYRCHKPTESLPLFDQRGAGPDRRSGQKPPQRAGATISPHSHSSDPASSFAAGERVHRTGRAAGQELLILIGLRRRDGQTSAELAESIGVDRHDPARRLSVMAQKGLVMRGAMRRCRACGQKCVTWHLTEKGRQ